MNKKAKIDPNKLKTRDYFMLKVISGVTKAGTFKDRKKQKNKMACRENISREIW